MSTVTSAEYKQKNWRLTLNRNGLDGGYPLDQHGRVISTAKGPASDIVPNTAGWASPTNATYYANDPQTIQQFATNSFNTSGPSPLVSNALRYKFNPAQIRRTPTQTSKLPHEKLLGGYGAELQAQQPLGAQPVAIQRKMTSGGLDFNYASAGIDTNAAANKTLRKAGLQTIQPHQIKGINGATESMQPYFNFARQHNIEPAYAARLLETPYKQQLFNKLSTLPADQQRQQLQSLIDKTIKQRIASLSHAEQTQARNKLVGINFGDDLSALIRRRMPRIDGSKNNLAHIIAKFVDEPQTSLIKKPKTLFGRIKDLFNS